MLNNSQFEQALTKKGFKYIAGVDEVGRGPLAGPMVVCAVILDLSWLRINDVEQGDLGFYSDITDSKLISENKRRQLSENIIKEAISYSLIEISNTQIDLMGISVATQKAFFESVKTLSKKPDHVLTDMFKIASYPTDKQTNIKSGDKQSITIGAASIIAKVYRDKLMTEFHEKYPQYGFNQHKGYGTKKHIKALAKYGPCELHRLSFEPIKSTLNLLKTS